MHPAADSPLQIPLQAAERFHQLGILPPWELCGPLGPALIAGIATLPGVTFIGAMWLLVVVGALLAAAACARLLKNGASLRTFLVVVLAPMQWVLLPQSLDRFLFWRLATVLLVLLASPARPAMRLVGALSLSVLMAVTAPNSVEWLDLVAFAEAGALPWIISHPIAPAAAAVGAAIALAGAARHEGMPDALVAPASQAGGGRVAGPRDLAIEEMPLLREARRLALKGDSEAAVLWLRALGARHLVVTVQSEREESAIEVVERRESYRLHRVSAPSPEAVLVSRSRLAQLPRIRGLQDVEALKAYLLWAARSEAVGVDRGAEEGISLRADAGPNDLILFRLPLRPGLSAEVRVGDDWRETTLRRDPLGFMVLDPGQAGRYDFRLRSAGDWRDRLKPAMLEPSLLTGRFPAIAPGSVVDAQAFTPSPFAPGDYLTAFGEHLDLFETRIRLDQRLLKPLYASTTQVNFRLPEDIAPGAHVVRVESGGKQSLGEPIEVRSR